MKGRILAIVTGIVAVAVLASASYVVFFQRHTGKRMRVVAHFEAATGLYKGSSVRILGVTVGTVTEIEPEGTSVRVALDLPADTKVPANAIAVIVPPSLVSDRYVQLAPVYRTGALLADGADIPQSRTRTPVELDKILESLDTLLTALGPDGANEKGSLSRLLKVGAANLDGTGSQIHTTITDLSRAVSTLAANKDDFAAVIHNLADFSETLARSDGTVRRFNADLANAAEQLAGERETLTLALRNLSIALGEVGDLVRDRRGLLGSDIKDLVTITNVVLKNQRSLIEALDVTPLLLDNLSRAVNTDRHTLDIRQDNQQQDNPDFVLCSILQPFLPVPVPCPPAGTAPTPGSPTTQPSAVRHAPPGTRTGVSDEMFTVTALLGATGGAS